MSTNVVILGAGMTGLAAARAVLDAGLSAVVVDKGRAVGGRMATRRIGDARFDHGAQHYSVRSDAFRAVNDMLREEGVATTWYRSHSITNPDRGIEQRHVGVGGMRRIPEHLASAMDVRTGVTVNRLVFERGSVSALSADGVVATGKAAIITPPVPQSLALLSASEIEPWEHRGDLEAMEYDATLAIMATLEHPSALPDGHLALSSGPIAWMADNQHKGVSEVPALTIHSSAEFATEYLEAPHEVWVPLLLSAAGEHINAPIASAVGHRWRYSLPLRTIDVDVVPIDAAVPVLLAGEVFAGARVEGAFLSGRAAARWTVDAVG